MLANTEGPTLGAGALGGRATWLLPGLREEMDPRGKATELRWLQIVRPNGWEEVRWLCFCPDRLYVHFIIHLEVTEIYCVCLTLPSRMQ